MGSPAGLRPLLLAVALALAAGFAIAVARPGDIVFWPDSAAYFAAAESIPDGAFVTNQNLPLTLFPPGYSLALAIVLGAGFERQTAAFLLNLISVVVIAAVVCRVVWSRTGSVGATATILLATLAVGPVPMRLRYAGSELPFMAMVLVALDWTDRRVWRRGNVWAFWLGLLCCAAFLTRYSGLIVAAIGGVWLLADVWRQRSQGFLTILSFAAGAVPLSLVWLLRSYVVAGVLMGERGSTVTSLRETLTGTASTLAGWIVPRPIWANSPLEWVVVFGGLAITFSAAMFLARRHGAETLRTAGIQISFAAGYVAFIAVSSLSTAIDVINDRLLAPAYIPAVIGIGLGVAAGLELVARSRRRIAVEWAWAAGIAIVVLLGVVHARWRTEPQLDYASELWRDSPTTQAAAKIDHPQVCFTNEPGALYLWTGHRCLRALTERYRTKDPIPDPLLERIRANTPGVAYYIWYRNSDPGEMIGNPSTLLGSRVRNRIDTADGEILEINADGQQ